MRTLEILKPSNILAKRKEIQRLAPRLIICVGE